MRFPLRRQQTPEAVIERISRIEGRFQSGPTESAAAPAPVLSWREMDGRVTNDRSREAEPAMEPEPVPADEPVTAAPAASFPLREQATAADSRSERQLRQVRAQLGSLREQVEGMVFEPGKLFELDIAALAADPEQAMSLPPAQLVQALLRLAEENGQLRAHAQKRRARVRRLTRALGERDAAAVVMQDVVAALHANLQDLRAERARDRLGAAQASRSLPWNARPATPPSDPNACD